MADCIFDTGQTLSRECLLDTGSIARITFPANWDGGDLTFQVAYRSVANGGAYTPYHDETGAPITIPGAASTTVRVPPLDWDGVSCVKAVASSAVGGARTVFFHTLDRN